MLAEATGANRNWLCSGQDFFAAMLSAIETAKVSVDLETYIYAAGQVGERFRDALVRAAQRGANVRVLFDALGSYSLSSGFWKPLQAVGGEARGFNPLSLKRVSIRNHRKLLVCDEEVAFVGGFNISDEYSGDGVSSGWCDLGLKIAGPLVIQLARSFEEMFARADLPHKRFARLRASRNKKAVFAPNEQLLLSGPGRGISPIKRALHRDLARAKDAAIMVAYFLPSWRFRRRLMAIAQKGGRVRLILAGKSDVAVSLLATRSLYRRLLKAGVEIYEYQPQILHAKLFVFDDVVYVGSANLDPRSLSLNYELMIRYEGQDIAGEARELFESSLRNCRRIESEAWRKCRSFWARIKQRWAYFLLVRIDPYIVRRQWRSLQSAWKRR